MVICACPSVCIQGVGDLKAGRISKKRCMRCWKRCVVKREIYAVAVDRKLTIIEVGLKLYLYIVACKCFVVFMPNIGD